MPFDPKLILPDDAPLTADGDLQLPGDLAALAEQLGDDARHLAAVYPADRSPVHALGVVQSRVGWLRPAGLVAASLAALLIGTVAIQQIVRPDRRAPSSVAIAGTAPGNSAETKAVAARQRLSDSPDGLLIPTGGTAISLTELSGPELEAVFDLWQRGKTDEQPGIAF